MIPVNVTLTGAIAAVPGVFVNFYWNVDAKGEASGSPDEKINDSPIELFSSSIAFDPKFLTSGGWLATTWLSTLLYANITAQTDPVYFGTVVVAAEAVDVIGNTSGLGATAELFVNSSPESPANFKRLSHSGVTGQMTFSFAQSYQLEV